MSNPFYLKNRKLRNGFLALLAVLFLWAVAPSGEAGFYSWKDENGKTHFTDDASQIPEKYRKGAEGLRRHRDLKSSTKSGRAQPSGAGESGNEIVVPLIPTGSGGFMVETEVNGTQVTLVLDTGASLVSLSREASRKIGLDTGSRTPKMNFSTANGTVWEPITALDSIKVGGAESILVEASIHRNLGRLDGLLGMTFLGDYKMEIDQENSQMILRHVAQAGEMFWGGKPGSWWKKRFDGYTRQVIELERSIGGFRGLNNPFASNLKKMVDFYRELYEKLSRKAAEAGVPARFRGAGL